MKNFYIFLDIDGVMYDWDYIISEVDAGRMREGKLIQKFKPESIEALNLLINELEKYYSVHLIISSTWREDMHFAVDTLKNNGLKYNKDIEKTPIYDPTKRGEQILDYLSDKRDFDFVIIDDEMFDFNKYFRPENIIKCEMFHSALSIEMVENYLNKKIKNKEKNFEID